jgi:uncharacterized repeat protein (TIGR02543 family)
VRRPDYRFVGWFDTDEPTGGKRIHANTVITDDTSLFARWIPVSSLNHFQLGDVDGDGQVTSSDATRIARLLVESDEIVIVLNENSEQYLLSADINGDGYITLADLTLFARWLVGHDVNSLLAK